MDIEIRTGRSEDLQVIMEMISRCVKGMQEGGSDQWDDQYPNPDVIGEDLEREALFVAIGDGRIFGMIVLDQNQEDHFETVDWKQVEGPHLIMHRLAVDPLAQGQGIARKLVAFAEKYAFQGGYKSIRLDTYSKNTAALKLYHGLGYELVGEVYYPGRVAGFPVFEKDLTSSLSAANHR
ncbi:GNAT family N-acetyltransferase [Paenibacillus sp. EC2-1]|uniref:GNAT family N-acetyltransferase n=1 Tax=Paenibacillus sp. EC2-1 TaxID=3388665 RepID=UPI003BEF3B9E